MAIRLERKPGVVVFQQRLDFGRKEILGEEKEGSKVDGAIFSGNPMQLWPNQAYALGISESSHSLESIPSFTFINPSKDGSQMEFRAGFTPEGKERIVKALKDIAKQQRAVNLRDNDYESMIINDFFENIRNDIGLPDNVNGRLEYVLAFICSGALRSKSLPQGPLRRFIGRGNNTSLHRDDASVMTLINPGISHGNDLGYSNELGNSSYIYGVRDNAIGFGIIPVDKISDLELVRVAVAS